MIAFDLYISIDSFQVFIQDTDINLDSLSFSHTPTLSLSLSLSYSLSLSLSLCLSLSLSFSLTLSLTLLLSLFLPLILSHSLSLFRSLTSLILQLFLSLSLLLSLLFSSFPALSSQVANRGLNHLIDRLSSHKDPLLLKIIRNISAWTFDQQQVRIQES